MEAEQNTAKQQDQRANKEDIKRYLETSDSKDTSYQNLWDTAKAVLQGKFIAMKAYIQIEEKNPINNLNTQLKNIQQSPKYTSQKSEGGTTNDLQMW